MIWSQVFKYFYALNHSKGPNHAGKAFRGHTQTPWTDEGEGDA